jgi:hypothetical protein
MDCVAIILSSAGQGKQEFGLRNSARWSIFMQKRGQNEARPVKILANAAWEPHYSIIAKVGIGERRRPSIDLSLDPQLAHFSVDRELHLSYY